MISKIIGEQAAIKFGELDGNSESALDPATILMFAQLALELVKMIRECRAKANDGLEVAQNPGLFAKIALRRHVKSEIGNKAFRDHGEKIMTSLLKTGAVLSLADMEDLYKEASETD